MPVENFMWIEWLLEKFSTGHNQLVNFVDALYTICKCCQYRKLIGKFCFMQKCIFQILPHRLIIGWLLQLLRRHRLTDRITDKMTKFVLAINSSIHLGFGSYWKLFLMYLFSCNTHSDNTIFSFISYLCSQEVKPSLCQRLRRQLFPFCHFSNFLIRRNNVKML